RSLALLVWPRVLSWDYSFHQIPMATPAGGIFALAGLVVLLGFLMWMDRRNCTVCFLGMFFFVALAPISNLFFLTGSTMAERYLYLPSIGVAGCMVAGVVWMVRRPFAIALVGVLLSGALAVRAWDRERDWTDYAKLWAHDVKSAPNSYLT